jgi:hypothetical protein
MLHSINYTFKYEKISIAYNKVIIPEKSKIFEYYLFN